MPVLNSDRIYIIGFMGSGKSTLGRRLAKVLGYNFIDTDQIIEEQVGMSISELFRQAGEKSFREMETRILRETTLSGKAVIATGGGMPCSDEHILLINTHGISIYLEANSAFLKQRLLQGKRQRPLMAGVTEDEMEGKIKKLLNDREPFYKQAHYTIPLPVESVETLIKSIGLGG
ncbi:MAG: shikimate kinase [Bacteroidia bacterium]|jgi:shikimate kinase